MAKLKVFVVHDSKVAAYMQPFFCRTVGEALRTWEATCNDGRSMMSSHPADFTLFEVAEYDEATGCFVPHQVHVNLGKALEQKKLSEEPTPMFPGGAPSNRSRMV